MSIKDGDTADPPASLGAAVTGTLPAPTTTRPMSIVVEVLGESDEPPEGVEHLDDTHERMLDFSSAPTYVQSPPRRCRES